MDGLLRLPVVSGSEGRSGGVRGAGLVARDRPGGIGGGAPTPSAAATAAIPPAMLTLYQEAATTCPGLPWTVLAAIGTVESDNWQSELPGVHGGANSAGAEGPMQFEPATFAPGDMNTDRGPGGLDGLSLGPNLGADQS